MINGADKRSDTVALPVVTIRPARRFDWKYFQELWEYHELFSLMVRRDISVKYKQTLFGVAWALLVPFSQMLVFNLIFNNIANLSSDGLPGPIFYYCAILPWTYFSVSLTLSSSSLVTNANTLSKIYFPRMILPCSPLIAGFFDFAIGSVILMLMMLWYGIWPPLTGLLIPFLLLIAFLTGLGVSLGLSALNVRYRDVRYIVPFLLQMWMYVTVIIPFSTIRENYEARFGKLVYLYGLNPLASVIEGFRWCLLHPYMKAEPAGAGAAGGPLADAAVAAPWPLLFYSLPMMLLFLICGFWYFRRTENAFADII